MPATVTLPLSFKAISHAADKAPFEVTEKKITALKPEELLIRVSYASINAMDPKLHYMNFFKIPYPVVLGFDFSGTVVAVGSSTPNEDIKVGSEVFGLSNITGGCFAEYVVVNRATVALRESIPDKEAATYGVAYLSAWEPLMMVDDISKRSGQWAYIPGGAGGVGHFAVQLCKAYGLNVISSASKKASIDYLKSIGVHAIDYSSQDIVKEVLAATGGKGVNIVYDATYSESSFKQSASVVADGGKWIRLGSFEREPKSEEEVKKATVGKKVEIAFGDLGRYWYSPPHVAKVDQIRNGLKQAVRLFREGKVKPNVTGVVAFNITDVKKAIEEAGLGKSNVGKVVIKIA